MTTNRPRAIASTGWSDAGLSHRSPLKRYSFVPERRHSAGAAIGIRELYEAMRRLLARKPRRTGGPKEPPEGPRRQSYWDDPALWMLMMH